MSSVKRNGLEDGSHSTAALGERFEAEHDSFTADLADGLHAMAQPLTILRSTIAMLSLSTDAEPSRSRCLDISVRQIDRTCRLFASLQELVVSQLEPADRKPIDLEELLTRKIEDHACDYQKLGVAIARAHSDKAPTALGDPHRVEQAISALLETALSLSSQGDSVEIKVFSSEDIAEVAVARTQNDSRKLNSTERLNLAVAKANILSQQGTYQFAEEPFHVTLGLPICNQAALCATPCSTAGAH